LPDFKLNVGIQNTLALKAQIKFVLLLFVS